MDRYLGLDYGSKTVGVAVSDPFGWTAQGLETIKRKDETNLKETMARLKDIIKEYDAKKIVLGNPLHMNNDEGERVKKNMYFKNKLEKETGLEVVLWDERLSTVAAERVLNEGGVKKQDQKQFIDKIAASIILQNYLEHHH